MSTSMTRAVLAVVGVGLLLPGLAAGPASAEADTRAVTTTAAAPAGTDLNSRFRGVNWADPRDNFNQDNNVPSGLAATDDYATTYRKSTQILGQFRSVLNANTVRLGINHATVTGDWWRSYRAIVDAATALDMNVILSVWPDRTFMLVGPDAVERFYETYQVVIDDFGTRDNVYLDLVNEPQNYNDDPSGWVLGNPTNWRDVAAGWLAHFPDFPRPRVIIAGTGPGGDWYLGSVGNDHRLDGTLLELHVYSAFGLSFDTYRQWKDWFRGQIAGFESRTIVGEFGTTLNRGADFNGPRDGSNPVSYLYAVTDTIRELGLGTVFWPGYRENDTWNMLTFTGTGSTEDPYAGHIVNPSAYDRLQWAYGLGTPAPVTFTSAASAVFVAGVAKRFAVRADGYPRPTLTVSGQLPRGLRFSTGRDGAAAIEGRAPADAAGTYSLVISGGTVEQHLVLTVLGAAPTPESGVVTGAITGARSACAHLYPVGRPAPVATACTRRNSSFEARTVPAGDYQVVVVARGAASAPRWYDGSAEGVADRADATVVTVTAGGVLTGVDVALAAPDGTGSVTGRITDTRTGAAVAGACAYLYPVTAPSVAAATACAAADGTFRADGVAAGRYTVGFADRRLRYRPRWFDGTQAGAAGEATSTPVTVTADGVTTGVDGLLLGTDDPPLVAGTGKISGRVVDASTGAPIAGAQLLVYTPPYGQNAQGPKNFAYTAADGTFQVNDVAPGGYIVQLRDPRLRPLWFGGTVDPATARTVTAVAGGTATGVDFAAVPAAPPGSAVGVRRPSGTGR